MKVLNIITKNLCLDGISSSVMSYYSNIDREKIKIDFVAQDVIDSIKKTIEDNGDRVYIIKGRNKNPIKYIRELIKIIKQNKYDIVHAHGSSAILSLEMIAAKKAGCKIRIAHSRNTKADHKIIDKILRPIFYKTYTDAFACGKDAGEWLFPNRKYELINNGKDTEKFKFNQIIRQQIREEYKINDKCVIGHVGSFNYQKNHDYLINVFYELKKMSNDKYVLLLIGDGTLRNEIEKKVTELGLKEDVIFLGRTEEVYKWLNAMDIMAFPSRFEGFPNVLIEWQISGLPCIISDTITKDVKVTELVKFKSLQESPKEWANEIINTELKDRNNKEYIEQVKNAGYDIKENAKRLEELYTGLYNRSILGEK